MTKTIVPDAMGSVRALHVSDLHTGTAEEPEVEEDLRALVASTEPELVIVSGDLTHRNLPEEHERAARLLRSLGRPLLVIPGNHDMPRWPPGRFTRTFTRFLAVWPETSVRPWKQQGGALRRAQVERVRRIFADAPRGALRVVALHHHLLGAPWRSAKRTIANRSTVLGGLVDAGAELVLSGHVHQSAVGERREFEVTRGSVHATTVVTAPGLGQPRPKRRGEARGLHLFEADERSLRVVTYAWTSGDWCVVADRRFPRGRDPLACRV
jgi:3',5'-cyclic AMP phosphodiesterase CpdA